MEPLPSVFALFELLADLFTAEVHPMEVRVASDGVRAVEPVLRETLDYPTISIVNLGIPSRGKCSIANHDTIAFFSF